MSTNATIRNLKTRNPNLPIYRAADAALKNAVFAYDMLTYSDSVTLTDISGNGRDAVFTAAPTTNAFGTVFDSVKYAVTPTDTQNFSNNVTGIFVLRHPAGGGSRYVMAQRDNTTGLGIGVITPGAAGLWTPKGIVGNSANDSTAEGMSIVHTGIPVTGWSVVMFKVINGHMIVEELINGTSTVTRTWAISQLHTKHWLIGAAYAAGAAGYLPLNNAYMGFCALFDGPTPREQDVALLAYVRELMAARGVTLP